MSSAISLDRNLVSFVLFCPKRNPIRCVAIDCCSGQAQVAARLHIRVIRAIRGGSYLCFSSQSFWRDADRREVGRTLDRAGAAQE